MSVKLPQLKNSVRWAPAGRGGGAGAQRTQQAGSDLCICLLGLCFWYVIVQVHAVPTVPSNFYNEFSFFQNCPLKFLIESNLLVSYDTGPEYLGYIVPVGSYTGY